MSDKRLRDYVQGLGVFYSRTRFILCLRSEPTSGWIGIPTIMRLSNSMTKQLLRNFLTNLEQPMPLPEKLFKLTRNLWRRVILRQNCCGHDGEPGC